MGFVIRNNILTGYIEEEVITDIVIPDGVQEINGSIFHDCVDLSSIFLPKSVSKVNRLMWVELEEILVDSENPFLTSEDGVLYDKEKTVLIRYPSKRKTEKFVIPDSVEMVENDAFSGCSYLQEIIIPNGVTRIGEGAFCGCDSLEKLRIPDKCQFSPDMPDDALGVGCEFSTMERLKIKIKYKGGVYNYQTYYDIAPSDE